MTSVYDTRES